MLEAEARWQSASSDGHKINLRRGSATKQFMKLSHAQASALQLHHTLEAKARVQTNEGEAGVALEVVRAGGNMLANLRNVREHSSGPGDGEGRAVTGLKHLHSQYVGPIGVGTKLSPDGCFSKDGDNPPETKGESSLSQNGQVMCSVSAQQQVSVVFDTGSTNIWISSDLCKKGSCVMEGRHRYNHTASETYEIPKSESRLIVKFGTGGLAGPYGVDNFGIGPFTVHKQQFALIQEQEGQVFQDNDGILGLAFPAMAAKGTHPFFDSIIQQKALEKNEFSFFFSKDDAAGNAIFWGGVDPAFHDGPIEYYPVVDPFYWSLDLHSFRIGDKEYLGDGSWKGGSAPTKEGGTVPTKEGDTASLTQGAAGKKAATCTARAIVDTGTTYFTAEQVVFDAVMEKLSVGHCKDMDDKSHPPMTFTLGSASGPREIVLTHDQYMATSLSDSWCEPAFMRIDLPKTRGPGMILGDAFLRHYMAVFDRQDGDVSKARIGFAKAASGEETSKRLRELTSSQAAFGT